MYSRSDREGARPFALFGVTSDGREIPINTRRLLLPVQTNQLSPKFHALIKGDGGQLHRARRLMRFFAARLSFFKRRVPEAVPDLQLLRLKRSSIRFSAEIPTSLTKVSNAEWTVVLEEEFGP